MKIFFKLIFLLLVTVSFSAFAGVIKGKVTDAKTTEPLYGASVITSRAAVITRKVK